MTSTLLVVMYSISDKKKNKLLLFFAILLSASTTGYVLFLLAVILKSKRKMLTTIVCGIGIPLVPWIAENIDVNFSYRISTQYVLVILEYTIEQYIEHLRPENYSFLLGENYLIDGEPVYLTDNGVAPFFYTNGLLLCIAYLGTAFWPGAIKEKAPFILFFIGAIHYPAIFTMPGQVLFALLLANKFRPALQAEAPLNRKATEIFDCPISGRLALSKHRLS